MRVSVSIAVSPLTATTRAPSAASTVADAATGQIVIGGDALDKPGKRPIRLGNGRPRKHDGSSAVAA